MIGTTQVPRLRTWEFRIGQYGCDGDNTISILIHTESESEAWGEASCVVNDLEIVACEPVAGGAL